MTWQPLNLASEEFSKPSLPPTLCGLIYAMRRHVLSGPPESLKTLLVLVFAIEAMRAGGTVAFVDFESGPAETRRLLEDLGATVDELGEVLYFEPDGPPSPADIAYLLERGVTFVVIDAAAGAYSVSGLDDNKRDDAEKFARAWVQPLWQQGVTTVLLDHVVKAAESRGRYTIGSERKVGTADVHLGLEAVKTLTRGMTGLLKVRVHKDRPGHLIRPYPSEVELVSDPETHAISWTFREPAASSGCDGWQPTVLMQKVSAYLVGEQFGASRNEIQKAVTGKSNEYKRQAIDALVAGGYAVEEPGARGARMVRHVKSFTSPDLAATTPGDVVGDFAHLAHPLQGGEVRGEVDGVEQLLVDHADIANGGAA